MRKPAWVLRSEKILPEGWRISQKQLDRKVIGWTVQRISDNAEYSDPGVIHDKTGTEMLVAHIALFAKAGVTILPWKEREEAALAEMDREWDSLTPEEQRQRERELDEWWARLREHDERMERALNELQKLRLAVENGQAYIDRGEIWASPPQSQTPRRKRTKK